MVGAILFKLNIFNKECLNRLIYNKLNLFDTDNSKWRWNEYF